MKAPTLHELLDQFNTISTWTKEKKRLKNKVIENIQKEKLYVFVGSKHLFKMTRFGEIRKIFSKELSFLKPKTFKAKEVELVCMGQEHCVYIYIAVREIHQ